ncbi:MAG: hypothetical protein IV090_19830 [Candidatus Sericytochromatia bacterium]|nr:hypothetical protein [Candidatus Sericytochromatia bacterium]
MSKNLTTEIISAIPHVLTLAFAVFVFFDFRRMSRETEAANKKTLEMLKREQE